MHMAHSETTKDNGRSGTSQGSRRTCSLVLSAHVEDAIGINLKGNLNLWHATGRWRDACEVELP